MLPSSLTHICVTRHQCVSTLRPRQNGRHFADDIFKCIFLNENVCISLKISLKFVSKVRMNNTPAMVQKWLGHYWRIYASLGLNELNTTDKKCVYYLEPDIQFIQKIPFVVGSVNVTFEIPQKNICFCHNACFELNTHHSRLRVYPREKYICNADGPVINVT